MYYTNYFKNIDLSSLSSVCDQCISSLRTAGQTTISFSGIVEANMSDKLETALADNKSQIDKLISAIEKIKEALTVAQEIVSKQKAMESESPETAMTSASEVQTKLKSFCNKIDELSNNFDYLVSSITGLSSSEFKANVTSLEDAKSTFTNYSNNLVTGYDTLEGIKSTVSSDAYLLKAWSIIATRYDYIMKKRDNFENLLVNYIENIKTLENKLPTTTAITSFEDATTSVYAKTRDNSSEDTSFDSYSKSGRGEEIVIPEPETSSDSGSGDNGGGSGGYYGDGSSSGNNDDSGTGKKYGTNHYGTNHYGTNSYKAPTNNDEKSRSSYGSNTKSGINYSTDPRFTAPKTAQNYTGDTRFTAPSGMGADPRYSNNGYSTTKKGSNK